MKLTFWIKLPITTSRRHITDEDNPYPNPKPSLKAQKWSDEDSFPDYMKKAEKEREKVV